MFALVSAAESTPVVRRIDQMIPRCLESAFFSMGSFLASEPRFSLVKGVWKTIVGYGGGRSSAPSYGDVGDHSEVIMVKYDPQAVTYGQLLELFLLWCSRSPGRALLPASLSSPSSPSSSSSFSFVSPRRAFRIFVKNASERRLAHAAIERCACSEGGPAFVRVSPSGAFHEAERWCQKYFLRSSTWLMQELRVSYPDEESLLRSTLAARLNGILGLPPYTACLPEEIELYDLSEAASLTLKRLLS
ncbi:MAG: peptide-methionine (S)-S-oxide reductase [Synergistaceae bacterium]|jgi:peptide-methionine (S)-S-oxide reductase|nr:peptide-methionine (S)-S-oxide reductase [Synergistaceae bacterium]